MEMILKLPSNYQEIKEDEMMYLVESVVVESTNIRVS